MTKKNERREITVRLGEFCKFKNEKSDKEMLLASSILNIRYSNIDEILETLAEIRDYLVSTYNIVNYEKTQYNSFKRKHEVIGQYPAIFLEIDTSHSYYDSIETKIYIRYTRLETDEEYESRLAKEAEAKEIAKKQKEQAKKEKQDKERKEYERLKKKFEGK